jgi:sulfotransferase
MKKILFNSSMPRSGSELLQVLLHQNPDIYGSATSPLLEFLYGMRANTGLTEVQSQPRDLMRTAFARTCKAAAEGYYSAITDRPIVCDKNRGWAANYNWTSTWADQPKMIVMVRDLRGIIASMERLYRKNTDTTECAALPLQLDARVFNWLNLNAQPIANNPNVGAPPVGLALNRLRGLFMDGTAEKVLFVKCEDLTKAPAATMSRIYAYLKLPEFAHDFDNIRKEVEEDTKQYGVFGDHNVVGKIAPLKDWNGVLPDKLSDVIRQDFDWYFSALGY